MCGIAPMKDTYFFKVLYLLQEHMLYVWPSAFESHLFFFFKVL